MSSNRIYRCQHCNFSIPANKELKGVESPKYKMGEHYEKKHKHLLPPDMNGFRYFYYLLTKKERGKCSECGGPTEFVDIRMKYLRLCPKAKCKESYIKMRNERMNKVYGKTNILRDPEVQAKMQKGRKIAGEYKWSTGKGKLSYLGSYEADFLKYLDLTLGWPYSDIMECPFQFMYDHHGEICFYMPDFFIPSMSLLIEIKDDGSARNINPDSRARDIVKNELLSSYKKDFNYIKIAGKDYSEFNEFIRKEAEKEDG